MRQLVVCAVSLLATCMAHAAAGQPAFLSQNEFQADAEQAAESGKLHMLYFTTDWCGFSRKLEREAWTDENVVSLIEANAIVTRIEQGSDPAFDREHAVTSTPTVVFLDDGDEVLRLVGLQDTSTYMNSLLSLESVSPFETDFDYDIVLGQLPVPLNERLVAGSAELEDMEYERSLVAFDSAIRSAMATPGGIDNMDFASYAESMLELVSTYDTARYVFMETRIGIVEQMRRGERVDDAELGWMLTSFVLSDRDEIVKWIRSELDSGREFELSGFRMFLVRKTLSRSREYALLGRMIDPRAKANQEFESHVEMLPLITMLEDDEIESSFVDAFRERMCTYYATALATEDTESARLIAGLLQSADDSVHARLWLEGYAKSAGAEPVGIKE